MKDWLKTAWGRLSTFGKQIGPKLKPKLSGVSEMNIPIPKALRSNLKIVISAIAEVANIQREDRVGLYFNPLTWNIIFRPVAALVVSLTSVILLSVLLLILTWVSPLSSYPLGFFETMMVTLLLVVLFAKDNDSVDENLEVPPTMFVAQVSWLGIPLPLYLSTGHYSFLGKIMKFGYITKVAEPFTDNNGFVRTGEIQFPVWNDAGAEEGSNERIRMSAPTRGDSEIWGALTLVLEVINPQKCLDSTNPALDLGDRARQEFRELVSQFVDTDIPKLHKVMKPLFLGEMELWTAFIGRPVGDRKVGSMVSDMSGDLLYTWKIGNEKDSTTEKRLAQMIVDRASEKMLREIATDIQKDDDGNVIGANFRFTVVKVENPIRMVLDAIGCRLARMSFADLEYSEKVKAAAEKASAEAHERVAQVASARTRQEVARIGMSDKAVARDRNYQFNAALAAAEDNPDSVQVVFVPGADNLTRAAVAGANQLNRNKNRGGGNQNHHRGGRKPRQRRDNRNDGNQGSSSK